MSMLARFVGIPYEPRGRAMSGLDCWGIVLIAARELYALELPEFFYSVDEMLPEAVDLIAHETAARARWRPVSDANTAPKGSVHIFRIKGYETHCGLCLGGGEFLHSLAGRDSCVERLADWRQRLTGTYTWSTIGK